MLSQLSQYKGLTILLTKTTAVQNYVALSYHRVSGLYFGSCFCDDNFSAIKVRSLRYSLQDAPSSFPKRHDPLKRFLLSQQLVGNAEGTYVFSCIS